MHDDSNSEIAAKLTAATRILAVTGAGISTSSGLPDFRSPGGLYETVMATYDLPYPEAIFDINYFHNNPRPFFQLSQELLNAEIEPTPCHHFLAQLEKAGKIELILTQNIDMLHHKAGSNRVIECHGSYRHGRCLDCLQKYSFDDFSAAIKAGRVPYCDCGGIIKPDVVFFGESLPQEFLQLYDDPPQADLLLVMGSSLTVQPIAGFALDMATQLSSILINREPGPYDSCFDQVFHGELDQFTALCATGSHGKL